MIRKLSSTWLAVLILMLSRQAADVWAQSILANGGFEEGAGGAAGWGASADGVKVKAELATDDAHSGKRAACLKMLQPWAEGAWSSGGAVKASTFYTLTLWSKSTMNSGSFFIRLYTHDAANQFERDPSGKTQSRGWENALGMPTGVHIIQLGLMHNWRPTIFRFATGPKGAKLSFGVEVRGGPGIGSAFIDDVSIEARPFSPPLKNKKLVVLSDAPTCEFGQAMWNLGPDSAKFIDITKPYALSDAQDFACMAIYVENSANIPKLDLELVKNYVTAGRTAIMNLDEFAATVGCGTQTVILPRDTSLSGYRREDFTALNEALRAFWPKSPQENLKDEKLKKLAKDIELHIQAPMPKMRFKVLDKATTGFHVGDEVAWYGWAREGYPQLTLKDFKPDANSTVLATSTVNDQPVMVEQKVGKGVIVALDLKTLHEPACAWELRGSFNKYAFHANLIARAEEGGAYVNKRLEYPEYVNRLKKIAAENPGLELRTEAYLNGYNVFSLNLGTRGKPIYLYMGMFHAEDEYMGSYGLLDFARFLARHRKEPPYRAMLANYHIKIMPLVWPREYMSARIFGAPGKEAPLKVDPLEGEGPLYVVYEQHQANDQRVAFGGGATVHPNAEWDFKAIERANAFSQGNFLYYDYNESALVAGRGHPDGDGYFTGADQYANRYTRAQIQSAKLGIGCELGRFLHYPDVVNEAGFYLRSLVFDQDMTVSYAVTEQILAFCLGVLLTPVP